MPKKITVQDGNSVTFVHFILDMSGSMSSVWDATISGFNEYLNGLRDDGNSYKIGLTLFDDVIETPYSNVDLKDVKDLTSKVYRPRGMTALYDAVGKTVDEAKKNAKSSEKHLVVIMTDGGENASKEYTQEKFIKIKNDLDKDGNWTFVFLGANQDAWGTASNWGFSQSNVATYNATKVGSAAAFRGMSAATTMYASGTSMTTDMFMSKEIKKDIEETK